MSFLTRADRITIAHVCQDWATAYAAAPVNLPKSLTVRYLTDHHLRALSARHGREMISRAVASHLDAHPKDLTAPRVSHRERRTRQAERDATAARYLKYAYHHYAAAEPYEALALIDRAELASPTYKDFSQYRRAIQKRMRPFAGTDLTRTSLRHRALLPLANPHPGPPVMHHGSHTQEWVYPGRLVIEGNWPAAIPEHCTATDEGLTDWIANRTVLVCTGCGLDCT
ncbi:hypothetical protein MED01_005762 [Micromonospora sp. MED01]|uniref:hypothetical protein n=1 Tax=Micromonospora alfalfae TaxID=2911212 RepID=UPI001EE8EBA6|nr:hypothetical protein [Micromonospora alfalfae]MCG5466720.1 hypothetical protein [Micromonospora alfalfae]